MWIEWCCINVFSSLKIDVVFPDIKVAGEGQIELLSKHHLSRLFATIIMWCVCVLGSRILQWKTWWQLSTNWELWRWNTVGLFLDQKGVILFFKRSFLRSFFQVLIWFQKMNQNKWSLGLADRCELSMKNVTWHFWFLKISPLLNLSVEDVPLSNAFLLFTLYNLAPPQLLSEKVVQWIFFC